MASGRAETTTAVLITLETKIAEIVMQAEVRKVKEQKYDQSLQSNLKEVYEKQKEKSLGGGMMSRRGPGFDKDSNMHMDVDEPPEASKGKNRK